MRCECRTLKCANGGCRNEAIETVMRPVVVHFFCWVWHGYKLLHVCDWCSLTGDLRVEEEPR